MTEVQHNAVVLKKSNEARFIQLWGMFAKSQANAMRLSQYIQFILERGLVSNRTTLKHFYNLFLLATEKRMMLEPSSPMASNNVIMEKTINKQEFIFLLNELGKYWYHNDKNHQDKVYNHLLGEKAHVEKDAIVYSRMMPMEEVNRKMTMESAIQTFVNYEDEFRNLYLIYVEENYFSLKKKGRLLLNMKEVELQNKKMTAVSFMRFLKESEMVPHLTNIEHAQDMLEKVVPAKEPRQTQFYLKHFLVENYSKDLDNPDLRHDGDPGLLLFEFIFTVARIAVETSKQMDNAKKSYDNILKKFFSSYLFLRTNEQIKERKPFPNINKTFLINLKKLYQLKEEEEDSDSQISSEEQINPFAELKGKQMELEKMQPLQFNVPSMIKTLNGELPPMPEQISVQQELPPPYAPKFKDVPKITMGQQPPPEKDKGGKNNIKIAPKKQQLKKGEKPPRVFKFMDPTEQTKKVGSSQDYLQKLATELDYSLKPLSSLERGNIPLDPFPSIISQILYPPEVPQSVLPYIEAAINAHNEGGYALALENYNRAYKIWKDESDLSQSIEMYFQFSKGGVFLSAGKDDYAFNSFYNCRSFSEKMNYLNPDRALPYCGLGQALYNAEEYQLAARCFLKAREVRQALLGIESVDTVTTFNNIGCCFFMLDRPKEALSYFKIAREVLISELGEFHERSQTALENVGLCNKAFYQNSPEYRKLWQVFEKDRFGKKKKKKKKDGKKK